MAQTGPMYRTPVWLAAVAALVVLVVPCCAGSERKVAGADPVGSYLKDLPHFGLPLVTEADWTQLGQIVCTDLRRELPGRAATVAVADGVRRGLITYAQGVAVVAVAAKDLCPIYRVAVQSWVDDGAPLNVS
jgi:Protein of unknown function (DUF732)